MEQVTQQRAPLLEAMQAHRLNRVVRFDVPYSLPPLSINISAAENLNHFPPQLVGNIQTYPRV